MVGCLGNGTTEAYRDVLEPIEILPSPCSVFFSKTVSSIVL